MVPGVDLGGPHCARLRTRTPEGTQAKFWDKSVLVGREAKGITLPQAWTDPAGDWAIVLTDLFSPATAVALTMTVE